MSSLLVVVSSDCQYHFKALIWKESRGKIRLLGLEKASTFFLRAVERHAQKPDIPASQSPRTCQLR